MITGGGQMAFPGGWALEVPGKAEVNVEEAPGLGLGPTLS